MKATSHRRQIIMAVLLTLAVAGAAIRHWADNPSLTRDMGTLLLVLWVPAIGNLIAFVVARIPRRVPAPAGFAPGTAFAAHIEARMTPLPGQAGAAPQSVPADAACTLLVGKEGFTARTATPLTQWLAQGKDQVLDLQFLRPTVALPRFAEGTTFHILVGTNCIGTGQVTRAGT